jgi:predicted ATP-grasp superfamily ATP-dependent carboligase
VTDLSLEILRATDAVGFCSVEYKRDPRTDLFYITEPTIGRVNLQIGTAVANGANIPARAYFHLTGQPDPGEPPREKPRTWIYLDRDFRTASYYVKRGELTWGGWLRSISGPKAFAVWRFTDVGMLGGWLRYMTLRIGRAIGRRILPEG